MPRARPQEPADISQPGWRHLLERTWHAISSQHSSLIAAGIAFYGMWSFFPALAAVVALGGWLFGEADILRLLSSIRPDLPESVNVIVVGQLAHIAQHTRTISIVALLAFIAVGLWSAMRAMRGLVAAFNIIYQEEEKREFWRLQAMVFGFTCYGGVFLLMVLGSILAIPPWVHGTTWYGLLAVARWPLLMAALMASLAALYRYGPSRRKAKWRWVSWGATAAGLIWATGSLLFSFYVSRFAQFNPLFGSLGAVIVFYLWSYLTVLTVLAGAQVNAEMERETGHAQPARESKVPQMDTPRRKRKASNR